jgi:uncharacterized RDD family membrane protein YckC
MQKIESGEIRGDTLAHTEGLANWLPVRQVLAQISAKGAATPFPAAPNYMQPNAYAIDMAVPTHRYAGFFQRFAAYIVDNLIVGLLSTLLALICFVPAIAVVLLHPGLFQQLQDQSNNGGDNSQTSPVVLLVFFLFYGGFFVAALGSIAVNWLYHAFLDSGKNEGTWGKQMMGIHVTDLRGNRISFMRATGRHFARIFLTNATCAIGYLIALFVDKKQTLHDLVASTIVIER